MKTLIKIDELKEIDGDDVPNYDKRYFELERLIDRSDVLDTGCEFLGLEVSKIE